MKKKLIIGILAVLLVITAVVALVLLQPKDSSTPSDLPTDTTPATEAATQPTTVPIMEELDGLPKLYIEGDIDEMNTKEDLRYVTVNFEAGSRSFQGYAELKIQGGTSLEYEKKNYTIKLYKDADHIEKLKVDMGWGAESRYCLKANWVDKTHSRNIVTANLVTEAQRKYGVLDNAPANGAIDGFPIEIYENGEFLGLYTFNIPKDEWLFAMDKNNPNHIVMESTDWQQTNLFFEEPDFNAWNVEVGTESKETLEKFRRVFDFVLNSSNEEFKEHFHEYFDFDAALNYSIIAEVAFLGDNVGKNMLMVTYDGQIWYPCLYDLDTSWGPWWDGKGLNNYRRDTLHMTDNYLFRRIREVFGKELADRYFELREDVLSKENIMGKFQQFKDEIPPILFVEEVKRWGHNIPGFGISQIEEYLDIMLPRLDLSYGMLRDRASGKLN